MTTGAGEALAALVATLIRPGDHAVVGWPAPDCLTVALERAGCDASPVDAPFDADADLGADLAGHARRLPLLAAQPDRAPSSARPR